MFVVKVAVAVALMPVTMIVATIVTVLVKVNLDLLVAVFAQMVVMEAVELIALIPVILPAEREPPLTQIKS